MLKISNQKKAAKEDQRDKTRDRKQVAKCRPNCKIIPLSLSTVKTPMKRLRISD